MIFITGDTHSDWMSRFNSDAFPEGKTLSKDDYVIVCGDFGLWHDTNEERYHLKWLEQKPFTTLFVCGNHENYDRLYQYPVEEWHGGKIHKISDSVYHLMRGQVFEIEENLFFTFGGDCLTDYLQQIKENTEYSKWFFGHMHVNENIPWEKSIAIFEQIIRIA